MGRRDLALLVLIACLCADARPAAAVSAFQVKDIYPGGSSNPTDLTAVSPSLFDGAPLLFAATDGTHGIELWRSDGTSGGTFMVSDILPGSSSSVPAELTRVAGGLLSPGRLFFRAFEGTAGNELWKTDGTAAGTVLVKDIRPGAEGISLPWLGPNQLVNVNGTLFFSAITSTNGQELWKSDGTPAGTVLVRDIHPGAQNSSPGGLTAIGSVVFFSADDGTNGRELWISDGTFAGTAMVADLEPAGSSSPEELTVWDGILYFTADVTGFGRELY
ncbi:MAG: ELWxxDGT repeat protein, partial [Acidimicrobiia bacterium]